MPIEWEQSGSPLAPLKKVAPPVVAVEALVAVAEVRLTAADIPPRILRQFYEHVLGMKFLEADADALRFAQQRRHVLLLRAAPAPGNAAFLIRDFPDQLLRLRDHGLSYELIHGDAGLTRIAYLRDPAGNWIQLVETRAF